MGIRCADHVTHLYPQKLALTSPTSGGRSVGIVRSRTKATEFFFFLLPARNIHFQRNSWKLPLFIYNFIGCSLSKLNTASFACCSRLCHWIESGFVSCVSRRVTCKLAGRGGTLLIQLSQLVGLFTELDGRIILTH